MRALDRFQYKLEGERSEQKIFITIFLHHLQTTDQTFFLYHFMNKLFFSHKGLNKLFIFQNLLNNLFFSQKTIAPAGIKWSAPKDLLCKFGK